LYGIENVRATVDSREQDLALFQGGGYVQFSDARATPVQAKVFVRVFDPYKSVYGVDNWRQKLTDRLQADLSVLFNGITHATAMATTNFLTLFPVAMHNDLLTKARGEWGVDVLRVTVEGFNLDPEYERVRRENLAAALQAATRATQICGTLLEMQQRLVASGYAQNDAQRLAEDIFKYSEAAKTGTLLDFRTQGGPSSVIAAIAAIIGRTYGLGRP
jgi:regulator of protease activity HflC (stomatin/prohibitin superfamily)